MHNDATAVRAKPHEYVIGKPLNLLFRRCSSAEWLQTSNMPQPEQDSREHDEQSGISHPT
jgi:hypothetical protein